MKVIICDGIFGLSKAILETLLQEHPEFFFKTEAEPGPASVDYGTIIKLNGQRYVLIDDEYRLRTLPWLIKQVENNPNAGGEHGILKVVEVPDGIEWFITTFDGTTAECVCEKFRTWGFNGEVIQRI